MIDTTPLVTAEDTKLVRTIDAADLDGDQLVLSIATPPAHGSAGIVGAKLTYTPSPNFHGFDSIAIGASDGTHDVTAAIMIEVTSVNDPPTGVGDTFAGAEDAEVSMPLVALLANDTDVDGDALSIVEVRNGVHGSVVIEGDQVRFTPVGNYSGTATFEYLLSDGAVRIPVTVGVMVAMANDPPVAVDDTFTATEDIARTIAASALVANDLDPDGQTLVVTEVANPTNGTVSFANGAIKFTPAANFNGDASFDYTVSDGAETAVGHVTITFASVDDKPIAVDDAATTNQDTAVEIPIATLLANDTDIDGPPLVITALQSAVNGTVVLGETTVTFTPAGGFSGDATFEYVVSDGARTDVGLVTVTVVHVPVCGDTVVEPPEECDDGNTDGGDGCGATCLKEVVAIAIVPGRVAIDQQQRVQLRAIGTLFGGGTRDVTATATWASTLTAVATVDGTGRVDGLTEGTTSVSAAQDAATGATDVTVGSAVCTIKINEIQTRGDSSSPQADELAELVNPCTFDVDVTGWNLVYRSAAATVDANGITAPLTGVFPAGTFRLYVGVAYNGPGTVDGTFGSTAAGFADAAGGVAIRSGPLNTGAVVDAVAWGTATNAFVSGPNAPTAPANQSFGRRPFDGADTNVNGTDFVVTDPTATPATAPTPRTTNFP